MFRSHHIKAQATLLAIGIQMWCSANAQNFTTQVVDPVPFGLKGILPGGEGLELGPAEGFKGGFFCGLGVYSFYDSNFFLRENNAEDELGTSLSPYINYLTDPEGGASVSLSASYTPTARFYLDNSDLNGIDHCGNVALKIEGSRTVISAFGRYNEISGTDRLSGEFVEGSVMSAGVQGTYQMAARTSLVASLTTASSDYGSGSLVGSDFHAARVGGFWSATERFSFGPAIRYTMTESDNTGTRDAWALSMQAKYQAGERVQISGSLGVETAKNSGGGEDGSVGLTGDLTANYAISERWGWRNTIRYVTVPSPTELDYVVNDLTISTALTRQLLRATVSMGMDLSVSDYESVGAASMESTNDNNIGAFLGYRRSIFSERLAFDSRAHYAVNNGRQDWSRFQVTVGLGIQF